MTFTFQPQRYLLPCPPYVLKGICFIFLCLMAVQPAAGEDGVQVPIPAPPTSQEVIDKAFAKVDLYHTLMAFEPEFYEKILPELQLAVEKGADRSSLYRLLIEAADEKSEDYIRFAKDSTLDGLYHATLSEIRYYQGDPAQCISYLELSPQVQPDPPLTLPDLPEDYLKRKARLLNEVFLTANKEPITIPADKDVAIAAIEMVFKDLASSYSIEERMQIDSDQVTPGSEQLFCRFYEEFYADILALPDEDKRHLLRFFVWNM